jgi:hypothetical protein
MMIDKSKMKQEAFGDYCFITGSHAYGTPRPDSDIDLVTLVNPNDRDKLIQLSDSGKQPIRYGKLNIIACCSKARFDVWKEGTEKLMALGTSVDNAMAKNFFDNLFQQHSMSKSEEDSGGYDG